MPSLINRDLKLFYNISEVAEMFKVQPTLLRYWEKMFPQQISPKKAARNIRQYSKDDIEQIRIIYNLVKVRGLKLEAAAELLKKNKEGVEQKADAIGYLQDVRKELLEIKAALNELQ